MVIDVEVSVSGSSSNLVTDSTCTLIHETLTNISDRLGVTMHPAQPDWTFDEIVKV